MLYSTDPQDYQPTADFTSTFPKTEVKDLANFGVTCGQHVESSSRCWFSRPGLPLKISSYWNSSRCDFGTDWNC